MKNRKSAAVRSSTRKKANPEPSLDHDVQRRIGQQLRTMYDDVVKQGVPGRFVDLLGRLDEKDGKD